MEVQRFVSKNAPLEKADRETICYRLKHQVRYYNTEIDKIATG